MTESTTDEGPAKFAGPSLNPETTVPRETPYPKAKTIAREHADLRQALGRLADAAETLASSEPDMPSHRATAREFDDALDTARTVLKATDHGPLPFKD